MVIGEKVLIRAVEDEDLPYIHKWFNDFELMELFDFKINFINYNELAYKAGQSDCSEVCIYFTIAERDTKKPVGRCSLTDIDFSNKKCLCSLYIGDESSREKGYGTEAMYLLMKFAFEDLDLNRLGTWVFDYNKRAIKSYKKCGMKVEGIMREGVYRDGKYHDVYFMGILKNEYMEGVKGGRSECSEGIM